ncbi:MAG: hypothetical protein AB7I38_03985 [Dehalococcoidia bacterium]
MQFITDGSKRFGHQMSLIVWYYVTYEAFGTSRDGQPLMNIPCRKNVSTGLDDAIAVRVHSECLRLALDDCKPIHGIRSQHYVRYWRETDGSPDLTNCIRLARRCWKRSFHTIEAIASGMQNSVIG